MNASARRVKFAASASVKGSTYVHRLQAILLVSLYVLEFSLFILVLAFYKKGGKPFLAFLYGTSGIVFIAGISGFVLSGIVIIAVLRKGLPFEVKSLAAACALNLWSVVLLIAVSEAFIRTFAVQTTAGSVFGGTLLLPWHWEDVVARNRTILGNALNQGSYRIFDNELGWTIGSSRRSKDYHRDAQYQTLSQLTDIYPDLFPKRMPRPMAKDDEIYFSSVEGLRSPRAGMAFAADRRKRRIAIVGDSFTFGLEVRYEETWGHRLELAMGSDVQVLNFGVDGYGIDQMYLRYKKDVLQWHPEIVIFAFINDDFRRTMCVYGFLCFPGGEIPFAKPRFVVNGNTLTPLNLPLPKPEWVFARESINQLPFIEYDPSFDPDEWDWGFYDRVYAIRLLLSKYPRWPVARPMISDDALRIINGHLLRSFIRLAALRDSRPILVFFPGVADLPVKPNGRLGVAREVLRSNNIPYSDMSECVSKINPTERFVVLHYSATTNAAIAKCLAQVIQG